jgi:signal transduction histidine kinase
VTIQAQYRSGKRETLPDDPKVTLDNAIAHVALERSRADKALQDLAGRLMAAQEEERRRIGRELHDGLNQQLAMFAVELGMLARQVPAENAVLIDSISKMRQRAECLSDDLRHISHQLHPAVLEHLGLHSAIRSLCEEFKNRNGIRVWFDARGESEGLPRDIAVCLYRITQEALRNVARHSCANEAWVRISQTSSGIQLSIIDKGVGFDVKCRGKAGLGLISMEERVRIIRGHFCIESASNAGTEIRITVPGSWKEH